MRKGADMPRWMRLVAACVLCLALAVLLALLLEGWG